MPKEPKEPIVLTADDVVAAPPARMSAGIETLPAAIAASGAHTNGRFIEYFTANIRNRNTRMAYALAVRQFLDWCEDRGLGLEAIRPRTVAGYMGVALGDLCRDLRNFFAAALAEPARPLPPPPRLDRAG